MIIGVQLAVSRGAPGREGIDGNAALIGERWRVGPDVILEASCPRIPCGTFQDWLAQADWIKRFVFAARPGPYFRVIESGEIQAGDQIEIVHRPNHHVTIAVSLQAAASRPGAARRRARRRCAGTSHPSGARWPGGRRGRHGG